MVTHFPVEPMHLLDLGIMKKMLTIIKECKTYGRKPEVSEISEKLLSLRRTLDELAFWKATEFRQFMLYTGMVVLHNTVNKDIYNHFLTLCTAIRMISCIKMCVTKVDLSEKLLKNFVENFGALYGTDKISFNVHSVLHVAMMLDALGHLTAFQLTNMRTK